MENVKYYLGIASQKYNSQQKHGEDCKALVVYAINKLAREAAYRYFGDFSGWPVINYNAFFSGNEISRPIRPDIFIFDVSNFVNEYDALLRSFNKRPDLWSGVERARANAVVYTAVMSVACCYDLWQKGSRKTPGTFFEVLMAAILQALLPEELFSKHIPLAELVHDESVDVEDDALPSNGKENASSVSTDLVIKSRYSQASLVVPLKITTRERIVQPFAHQRILDAAFGASAYTSFLVCISETQQVKNKAKVNHICVPGTVKLFQKYLAPVGGLYYCDVPPRYNTADVLEVIPVKTVGDFFVDAYQFFEFHKSSS
ncbi:hypothetical protein GCM10027040_05170 [Halomonas shantousis]